MVPPEIRIDQAKILQNFKISTNWGHQTSITIVDEETRKCFLIDVTVPGDFNIKVKEIDKLNYINV